VTFDNVISHLCQARKADASSRKIEETEALYLGLEKREIWFFARTSSDSNQICNNGRIVLNVSSGVENGSSHHRPE